MWSSVPYRPVLGVVALPSRSRRLRRFLLGAAFVFVAANGVLVQRISCLPGSEAPAVSWHWGLGGTVARVCGGETLIEYLVLHQWPLVLLTMAAGTMAVVWLRREPC